jgi:hypothetical protein
MWILPNNYQLSSAFAQDMVASKEDLTLPGLNIESSLMWRSKPSPSPTWLRRWKPDSWFQRLSSRILKPSQRTSFEAALTSSLEATRASRFQQQESDLAPKTPDTYGPTSLTTSKQFDLFDACLKTSKDTSASASEKSLATWKAQVTTQRGEYSQRLKSVGITRENESISWPTPTTQDSNKATKKIRDNHQNNLTAIVFSREMLPTPTARDWKGGYSTAALIRKDGKSRAMDALPNAAIGGLGTDVVSGHLNPDWVEWLMGVPIGWTDLGFWETE